VLFAGFVRTRRMIATGCGCILLAAGSVACGGDPGSSETLHDTAGEGHSSTSVAGPSGHTSPSSGASSAQPTDCTAGAVAEGCRCTDEGQVVACQAQRLDFGDYVTCAGVRQCAHGAWGSCLENRFLTH
jgi:hypothetical protein